MACNGAIGPKHPPASEIPTSDLADLPRRVLESFDIPGPIDAIAPLGRGLINDTFRVDAGGKRYVLQRINGAVFPDPLQIMANIQALDRHARQQSGLGLRVPALIPTRAGTACLCASDGSLWRVFEFIDGAVTLSRIERPEQAHEVGTLLGRFHTLLQSMPLDAVGVVLPGFHDSPAYLAALMAGLPNLRDVGLDADVDACLAFVGERQGLVTPLVAAQNQGLIPVRVVHGDPKLDNMLFDRSGAHALAMIDLDTLQTGLILHDLGDCLRSCCNRSGESDDGQVVVSFDLGVAEPILCAYAEQTGTWLTPGEVALIQDAIRLMPFELGLRFLNDHLRGNRYFKVSEPRQNLRKAMIQFALVRDIENKSSGIGGLIQICFKG